MDSFSFQQKLKYLQSDLYTNKEPEKNAVSHKVWAIFRPGFFASETTGLVHRQQACTGWYFKLCTPPIFSSLWSRESEVNNMSWKCPHRFYSDPRPVDYTCSRSLVGERFSMLQRKPLTDQMFWQPIADQSPTGRRSSTIICRPPNSFEKHPKKVVVGGRREVVDVILWQPIADWSAIIDNHLPTSDNLRQPPRKKWLSEVGDWLSL